MQVFPTNPAAEAKSGWPRALALAVLIFAVGLAGVGLALLWALPANQETFGEFARRGLGHHVVERSLTPLEGHGGNLLLSSPYYLIVILIGFGPWTLYLPGAVSAVLGGRAGGARRRSRGHRRPDAAPAPRRRGAARGGVPARRQRLELVALTRNLPPAGDARAGMR